MKNRKLLCLLLALALIFALASCQRGAFSDKLNDKVNGTDTSGDSSDDTSGGASGDSTGDTALPDYTALSQGLDENGFYEGVRALDFVTLPAFDDVVLPEFPQIYDRGIADGDFVNIDYVGSVDGVEFDGGSTGGQGSDIVVGYTSFIDDFIEQLKGHKPGENFDIEVTFPDPYQSEDLAGKDAVFNITINYIWDIAEDAARAIGFDSREQMAQYIAYNYASVEDVTSETEITVFLNASQCGDIPQTVTDTVRAAMKTQIELQASQYGLDADTFVQYMVGASGLDEYLEVQAPFRAQQDMIFQAVAEQEGLTVTDEDITENEYETYVDVYGKPYVLYSLLQDKVMDLISERLLDE